MDPTAAPVHADPAHAFVVEVLRTGLMLTDLVAALIEGIPEDAFDGEETGDVLIDMLAGTVRPAVLAAGPDVVEACTALLGALGDRTLADLKEAGRRAAASPNRRERRRRPRRP